MASRQTQSEGFIPSARELAREVLVNGPLSRAELGRRLSLSPASLTRLARVLGEAGFVVERDEPGAGGRGRPVRPLDVRMDLGVVVGVKLTGEAATVVATDLRARVLRRVKRTLVDHAPEAVATLVCDLVDEAASGDHVLAVGVGLGGLVGGEGMVRRAPFLGWTDVPLGALLGARFGARGGLLTVIENDLVALTRAEHWFGAARGLHDVAVVTIGAGVGYGLVIDDRVVSRAEAGVGPAAHIPLDPEGPLCARGHRGCATAMLTTGAITAEFGRRLGRPVGYDEVLSRARDGQADAVAVVRASGAALGRLLAIVADLTSVGAIVVSGEGIGLLDVAGDDVRDVLAEGRDPLAPPVHLIPDASGFDEWARAAAVSAISTLVLGPVGR
jgi:predicted NBD/HSP70 family sugar kinase